MRKIWNRKEKDRRKSLSANLSSSTKSNSIPGVNSALLGDSNNSIYESNENLDTKQSYYDSDQQSLMSKDHEDLSSVQLKNSHSIEKGQSNGLHNSRLDNFNRSSVSISNSTPVGNSITSQGSKNSNSNTNLKLSSLVENDYDNKLIKNNWINSAINSSEIIESDLKLLRAELKGSHLYFYKPNPSLNIKSFKLDNGQNLNDDVSLSSNDINKVATDLSSSSIERPYTFNNSTAYSLNRSKISITSDDTPNRPINALSYYKPILPHPDLRYDFDLHMFTTEILKKNGDNSLEAITHFLYFSNDVADAPSITKIIKSLPLIPNFGEKLEFITAYVEIIFEDQFEGKIKKEVIVEKSLNFLQHILDHFDGYLLKSSIAPSIIKFLEILSSVNSKSDEVFQFRNTMLKKQQALISLVNMTSTSDVQSLNFFNSEYFLKHISLIELARTISEIDLKYFKVWSPNIDKSLLMYSSIAEEGLETFYKKNPLIFNNNYHIHYLSRLLITHVFDEKRPMTMDFKARLLEKWIDLGCLLDKSGNMSSWLGISSIILSQPILRLTKVWALVSQDYIKLLKNDWSPVLFELDRRYLVNESTHIESPENSNDSYHIMAPRGLGKIYSKENVIPYFGDLAIKNLDFESYNIYELESIWKKINYSFDRWNEYLKNLTNFDDIIDYNDDVLRRYDSMGFIFSNEKLNQVLYLGAKNGELKKNQNNFKLHRNEEIQKNLLSLISYNCDSLNLEKIMKMSLQLEPETPEAYINPTSTNDLKTPIFNDQYFKIDLSKYDELVRNKTNLPDDNFLITNKDLVFGEIILDSESNIACRNETDDGEDDFNGLGIDVDEILNSDKFNSSISPPKLNKDSGVSIPKYASAEKLIDLLVLDSKIMNSNVHVNLSEYRFVFLLNYNSFMTTNDLLDKLSYRFVHSGNAVLSIMKGETEDFWNLSSDMHELDGVDYSLLLKIQINILKVLIVLLNNFYSNFSLELSNKDKFIKLLRLFSNEILQWYNSNKIDSTLEKSFENLVFHYKKLKKLFVKKTYRPIELSKFEEYLINEYRFNNSLHEVPLNRNLPSCKNIHKIEKFLYKFNKLLTVFYKGIKAEDWIKVFQILENSYEKNSLMEFDLQTQNIPEEKVIISNIFHYLESLNYNHELLLKRFPLVFRKLFKLYFKFKNYLLIQLTDSNISNEERLERMKTLLIMVKVSKLKMAENQFIFEGKGNIPSCIETAVVNIIYSPESRMFSSLWVKCSSEYNNLNSLLPRNITLNDLQSAEPLLPCFGWIIENLLTINKCPSYNEQMINFNKRYLIFNLIKELSIEDAESSSELYQDSKEFEFLLRLDESLVNQHINERELSVFSDSKLGLFKDVLKNQYLILASQNKDIVGPMHTITKKTSSSSFKRHSLTYKTNPASRFKISGLFTKSRPLSEKIVSTKELPDPNVMIDIKQKPVLIIPLRNKKIFPVYLMPLCFKIDSDAHDDYLFQATSEQDLNDWLIKLNYANRHWFYSKILNFKMGNNNITFGVPISFVCMKEHSNAPKFLNQLFKLIENNLKDVGIYRISSSLSDLNNLKSLIDRNGTITDEYDTHSLTSVVKCFFRELPDALITDNVISEFMVEKEDFKTCSKKDVIEKCKIILENLPGVNYNTLKLLVGHLHKVCNYSDENKMTPSNLATVIGPALTEASQMETLINSFGFMNSVLEKLIVNYPEIFNDKEPTSSNLDHL